MIDVLVTYTLAAFGACYLIGHSKITLPLRDWISSWHDKLDVWKCPKCHHGDIHVVNQTPVCPECGNNDLILINPAADPWILQLIECPMCLGTWIGLVTGFLFFRYSIVLAVFLGCYTAGANLLLSTWAGLHNKDRNDE